MKKVYAYLRASTDRQDASVPAQRTAIQQFCPREDFEIVRWFADDGVSGKSFDRPDYQRMRALVLGGNPDDVKHIVVWSLSRFARVDPDAFVAEKYTLAQAGVTIASATEPIRGERSMSNDLLGYISAYQNREFLVRLSTDVTRGMRALVSNGFWPSVAPLGYARLVVDAQHNQVLVNSRPLVLKRGQLKGNQNHVILVPGDAAEQDAVRFMFEKRSYERRGLRRIAAALNELGSKTIKGQPWKASTVRSCLTNVTYMGHTLYGVRRKYKGIRNQIEGVNRTRNPQEEWILVEDTHEALIPADIFQRVAATFHKANERAGGRVPGRRRLLLFSSAIVCRHCGASYQCRPRKKDGRTYVYYECSGRSSGRTNRRCDTWSVNAEKLKDYSVGEIQQRLTSEEFESHLRAYLVGRIGQLIRGDLFDTRRLDHEIGELEAKKRRLIDSIADGLLARRPHARPEAARDQQRIAHAHATPPGNPPGRGRRIRARRDRLPADRPRPGSGRSARQHSRWRISGRPCSPSVSGSSRTPIAGRSSSRPI